MAISEDFSFPTTTDTPPRFIESPPLWHRTSSTPSCRDQQPEKRNSPNGYHKEGESFVTEKPIGNKQRKSFSYIERGVSKAVKEDGREEEDGEEKMDMLWEDFNEEVCSSCGSGLEYLDISPPGKVAEFGRVKAIKSLKTSGGTVFSGKVYMKLLKKLFSLNSQRSIKRRTW